MGDKSTDCTELSLLVSSVILNFHAVVVDFGAVMDIHNSYVVGITCLCAVATADCILLESLSAA